MNPQTWNPGRRTLTIFAALLMASLPLAGLGGADPLRVSVDTKDVQGCDPARDLVVGCKVWSASNATDAGNTADWPDVDISPDGETAYIAHYVTNASFTVHFRLEAMDVATGDLLWGHMSRGILGDAVLSHDGQRVYALGDDTVVDGDDMVVRALDADTGALVWQAHHGTLGWTCNTFRACVATSLDDATVFAAGYGDLVAYDAADGELLWNRTMQLEAIAVGPDAALAAGPGRACDNPGDGTPAVCEATRGDETALYVVGLVEEEDDEFRSDLFVARLDAATGHVVWSQTIGHDGETSCFETADFILVSPDGGTVYAGGTSCGGLLLAFDAADGHVVWKQRSQAPGLVAASDADVSDDGSALYVAGSNGGEDAVWAVDAATGATVWSDAFSMPWASSPYIAASPDGERILAAATQAADRHVDLARPDFVTRAYDAANGTILWEAQEHKASWDWVGGVAVTPDGRLGLVTGMVWGDRLDPDVGETIAYRMVPGTAATADCQADPETVDASCRVDAAGESVTVGLPL